MTSTASNMPVAELPGRAWEPEVAPVRVAGSSTVESIRPAAFRRQFSGASLR